MPPPYFPLRWESTGDQWWYASPIDWAAANGHYDLVRQLLKLDGNNLIKLTSLRRIRRLETVWDDEEHFHDVVKCRSLIARELFRECETNTGEKNSLIRGGYGGWLLYTATSAGDLGFVQELLKIDPLLVFGEGEYGVTDMLYAGARSKNRDVFRVIYDFAASPRFLVGEEQIGEIDIPLAYKREMMNRALHSAARGGNLEVLKEIIGGDSSSDDVLGFRDVQGSTILHASASRGQVEVVEDLVASYDMIKSTDNSGNTALHVAAYRGHLAVVEALISALPSSIHLKNNSGETFLHMVISGFRNPIFHRIDRQIELMKKLVNGNLFEIETIVNVKNNFGRTALHLAIVENVHSDLIELLMSVRSINVNLRDLNYMTPLDLLKQQPQSTSSDTLKRHLISVGGIFSSEDYTARKTIASHMRMRSVGSPGTSFGISDTEIFLHTSIENASDISNNREPHSSHETVESQQSSNSTNKKGGSVSNAALRIKRLLRWPKTKEKKKDGILKKIEGNITNKSLVPLRERFSKPSLLPNHKRTLSESSNILSPTSKKKLATAQLVVHRRSRSSSFSKSSISSPSSLDKQKGVYVDTDTAGPSCWNHISANENPNLGRKQGSINKRLVNHYLCFGGPKPFVNDPINQEELDKKYKDYALSVA